MVDAGSGRFTARSLVDEAWYRRRYPDVTDPDVVAHFMSRGWREGRDPCSSFDTDWYCAVYPEVGRSGLDPLTYFLETGSAAGHRPNPLFDPQWYASTHPQAHGWDPFVHYCMVGRLEGLATGPMAQDAPVSGVTRCAVRPTVTVVISCQGDVIHLDRCVQALAQTQVGHLANVIVVDSTESGLPKHIPGPLPWLQVMRFAPTMRPLEALDRVLGGIDEGLIVLLSPDAEVLPGSLEALLAEWFASSGAPSPRVVAAGVRGALPWPEMADGDAVVEVEWPAHAVMFDLSDWCRLAGACDPHSSDPVRSVAYSTVSRRFAAGSAVLTNRRISLTIAVRERIPVLDIRASGRAILFAATARREVAIAALVTWLRLASCSVQEATESLAEWRAARALLGPSELKALPRWLRIGDQHAQDIIDESMLSPTAVERARRAIRDGDPVAAIGNVTDHPGSYAAGVAVIRLLPAERESARGVGVPRRIVQGWFDSEMPDDARPLTEEWVRLHPGWEYLFFDTESAASWMRSTVGSDAEEVFRSASPVGKSNLFRYAYLSSEGGVWSDIDDRALSNIEPLLRGAGLVVLRETLGATGDNFIAATPEHPVLLAASKEAFANERDGFSESPWLANGPGLFTRKVAAWLAGLLPGHQPETGYRVVRGLHLAQFVAVHEALAYKETDMAWEVAAKRAANAGEPVALSRRQQLLSRSGDTA